MFHKNNTNLRAFDLCESNLKSKREDIIIVHQKKVEQTLNGCHKEFAVILLNPSIFINSKLILKKLHINLYISLKK